MTRLSKYIPSIKSLEMFQSISKHRNLSVAAQQANITQPSVSKQIRLLEDRIGFKIFDRHPSGLILTPEGQRFLEAVEVGFGKIAGSIDEIRNANTVPEVTIQTDTEFASGWLLPVIKMLNQTHSRINTSIISSHNPPDFNRDAVDLGIPFGDGNWSGCLCTRLFYEEVYPVCSPEYFQQNSFLTTIDALSDVTLLGMFHPSWTFMNWDEWFDRLDRKKPVGKQKLKFSDFNVALQAAVNGQGVALGWKYLTDPLLTSGQLVRPIKEIVRTDRGQFITLPNTGKISEETKFLHDWILEYAKDGYLMR